MAPVDDLVPPDPTGLGPHDAHAAIDPLPEPSLVLDTPSGPHPLGPPTVDSDADGRADTALTGGGALGLATDLDGDGHVDVLTSVAPDGTSTTTHLAPPTAPVPGPDPWDEGAPPPPPVLDPATGRWIRSV